MMNSLELISYLSVFLLAGVHFTIGNYFSAQEYTKIKGQAVEDQESHNIDDCILKCNTESCPCLGVLFNPNKISPESKCKQILESTAFLQQSDYLGFVYYERHPGASLDIGIGVNVSSSWSSGRPTLYFPLDDIGTGNAMGEIPSNVQFTSDAIVGNALHNPVMVTGNSSYVSLGTYPSTSYCFPGTKMLRLQ